jgi:uncharacterized membrane protein AbrB (regulator of aidB expression)
MLDDTTWGYWILIVGGGALLYFLHIPDSVIVGAAIVGLIVGNLK